MATERNNLDKIKQKILLIDLNVCFEKHATWIIFFAYIC